MIRIADQVSYIKKRMEEIQKARMETIVNKPLEEVQTPDPYAPYTVNSEGYG